jgi:hypothetical protein
MALRDWVRVPTGWIEDEGLKRLRWNSQRSDGAAALMTLAALAHHADDESGVAQMTYEQITRATHLSRAKVSAGLDVLGEPEIIARKPLGRSTFQLAGYDKERGWGKLPAKGPYRHGGIVAFREFHLRRASELHALKMYFLFVARRGRDTDMANVSYNKITDYTGVERHNMKTGVSLLAATGLVHVEHVPSEASDYGIANAYRLAHLDSYSHMGTRGRGMDAVDFAES